MTEPKTASFYREFEATTAEATWHIKAQSVLSQTILPADFIAEFHMYWIVAGHKIRAQINNDRVLVALLRLALPKYGGEGILLYRGENFDRWKTGAIGFCWSSDVDTAGMFGRGLNATRSGGVLLQCDVPANAIIAGPNDHSTYLGESEYTVDPTMLLDVKAIKFYPLCNSAAVD